MPIISFILLQTNKNLIFVIQKHKIMPISPKQQNSINYIMGLTYWQYNCPWCKAVEIVEMKLDKDLGRWPNEDENLPGLEDKQKLIHRFLDNALTNYTPESFMYYEMLSSEWTFSQNHEHLFVLDKIVERIVKQQAKYRLAANAEINDYLANWHLDIESYEQATAELKSEIDLDNYCEMIGYGKSEEEDIDYVHLQQLFLNDLFGDSVSFFVNVLPEKVDDFFEKGKMPAVIALDKQIIGLFWWND